MLDLFGHFTPPTKDMKRRHLNRMQVDSAGVMDISSLVDICFLLLIYFIVTSVITPAERDLSVGMGGKPNDLPVEVDPMWISIDASGQVFSGTEANRAALDMDSSVRELPLLEQTLQMYQNGIKATGGDCMVVIDAHDEVRHQRLVDVLNVLVGMNINKVTFRETE